MAPARSGSVAKIMTRTGEVTLINSHRFTSAANDLGWLPFAGTTADTKINRMKDAFKLGVNHLQETCGHENEKAQSSMASHRLYHCHRQLNRSSSSFDCKEDVPRLNLKIQATPKPLSLIWGQEANFHSVEGDTGHSGKRLPKMG